MYKISKDQIKYDEEGNIKISNEICYHIYCHIRHQDEEGYCNYYLNRHLGKVRSDTKLLQDEPFLDRGFLEDVQKDSYLRERILNGYRDIRKRSREKDVEEAYKRCYDDDSVVHFEDHGPDDTDDEDYEQDYPITTQKALRTFY